jgi:Rps23 Pro-64 3,4-dihydroxylase Tpa1-like proline 4-hydroxylase
MTHVHFNDPFDHWIIDGFTNIELARQLSKDFVDYYNGDWFAYESPLEIKKTLNNWWDFPPTTYKFIEYLNSPTFITQLESITGIKDLKPDPGLHGAGWHIHGAGGKLNVHLDYSMHPKLDLERKLNLILYLSEEWDSAWGGNLELWTGDENKAGEQVKVVPCLFNRAVIFDTTQNSWHGFPDKIKCPEGVYRRSIAMYYLVEPQASARPERKRARYSPAADQVNDPTVLDLIEKRVKNNA